MKQDRKESEKNKKSEEEKTSAQNTPFFYHSEKN